ncbi:MAG: cation diffusion facilitator family transporter [Velocimicrobium sp.]
MITLLEKIFIKDKDTPSSTKTREAYGVLCGSIGICLNILLFIGKFIAGSITHSIAITADAFNNLSDAGSSAVTLLGFKLAGKKPDPHHPFGHGRIEYISGLIISAAILIMAYELIKSSIIKIIHPSAVTFSLLSCLILGGAILVKLYMAFYNKKIAKKIHSTTLDATAIDSLSDSLATSVVLIATIVGKLTHLHIDGYCGFIVGLFIFYSGFNAAKETISPLLGQPPAEEFVQKINEIVLAYEGVIGIHDLIVHNYGPGRVMLSLHAEVPASGDILTLHDMIDNIEANLREQLDADAVIHMDPIIIDNAEINQLKKITNHILKSLDPSLTFHDFRMVKGPTHTNLIFDIAVPFQFFLSDEELKTKVSDELKKINTSYFSIIQIDRSFTN